MAVKSTPFRYLADPVCLASIALYLLNRFWLKGHGLSGWIGRGYLNDLLCLPIFLPLSLYVQRLLGVRRHDQRPAAWEVVQHAVVFSVVFEVVLPQFPQYFRSTADPRDVAAYFIGGAAAWFAWVKLESTQYSRVSPPAKGKTSREALRPV